VRVLTKNELLRRQFDVVLRGSSSSTKPALSLKLELTLAQTATTRVSPASPRTNMATDSSLRHNNNQTSPPDNPNASRADDGPGPSTAFSSHHSNVGPPGMDATTSRDQGKKRVSLPLRQAAMQQNKIHDITEEFTRACQGMLRVFRCVTASFGCSEGRNGWEDLSHMLLHLPCLRKSLKNIEETHN
jgi:hypothetical protein